LVVINGVSHNAPIFTPTEEYWQPIADWLKQRAAEVPAQKMPTAGD
jgi:hypothetical protein